MFVFNHLPNCYTIFWNLKQLHYFTFPPETQMFHFSTTLPHLFLSVLLIYSHSSGYKDFLWGSDSKESACYEALNGFNPCVKKISWKRELQPTPVFLTGKSHGQKSLVGYSPWSHKRVGHDLEPKHVRTHVYNACCKVVACCDFHLHVYDNKWCWESYLYVYWSFLYLLWKTTQILCPFLIGLFFSCFHS